MTLRVRVRERAADQHLVIGEVEAVDEHAGAHRDLLVLIVMIRDVAVQRHDADVAERELIFRPDLGVIERIPFELGVLVVVHDLHEHVPLREVLALDGFEEVLRRRPEILRLDLAGFFGREAGQTATRMEVILDEHSAAVGVHHLVGVHAEAFHVAVRGRNAARAEQVRQHVHRFGRLAHEVEDPVRFLAEGDRIGLERVDDIRKLDRVADEEDREVIADQVPVAVFRIELDGKPARIAGNLRRVASADDR